MRKIKSKAVKGKQTARDIFGLLKNWKKPTDKIKDELKAGWE
jgi:hypothetical protein